MTTIKKFEDFGSDSNEVSEENNQSVKQWNKLDNNREIVGSEWRTAGKWGTIGIIAVIDDESNTWCAYLGLSYGHDENKDAISIAEWGTKLIEKEARLYFPKLDSTKYKD